MRDNGWFWGGGKTRVYVQQARWHRHVDSTL